MGRRSVCVMWVWLPGLVLQEETSRGRVEAAVDRPQKRPREMKEEGTCVFRINRVQLA